MELHVQIIIPSMEMMGFNPAPSLAQPVRPPIGTKEGALALQTS